MTSRSLFVPLSVLALLSTGCHSHPAGTAEAKAEQRAVAAQERQQLDQIPPPNKARFMSVRSLDSWENPYITVQPDMLTVHILFADQNPSAYGAGGMLRPVGARRQEVSIHIEKLGEAMGSVPENSWPYGRVVAIEEAHHTPRNEEPAVRRNVESTIATLNDLGLVVYDPTSGSLR